MRNEPKPRSFNGSAENPRGVQTLGWILLFCLGGSLYTLFRLLEPRSLQSIAESQAYVTLVLSESDVPGARVLGQSLLDTKTERKFIILLAEKSISIESEEFKSMGFCIERIKRIEKQVVTVEENTTVDATVALVWALNYEKVVFLTPDCLVRTNVDSLFDFPGFSAVADCCDLFDSGVWVANPNRKTLAALLERARRLQHPINSEELLNSHFTSWQPLPFAFNAQVSHLERHSAAVWHHRTWHIVRFDSQRPWIAHTHWTNRALDQLAREWWQVNQRLLS